MDASSGSGGKVVLNYGQGAVASGNSAKYTTGTSGKINLKAGQNFSTKLGSDGTQIDYTVVIDKAGVTGMNLTGKYALGGDLAAFGSMTPIGLLDLGSQNLSTAFSGRFEGLGHSISGLSINIVNATTQYGIGLFGATYGATISNLKLISPNVQAEKSNVGALIGYSINSNILNVDISGATVKSNIYNITSGGDNIGGIIGYAAGTTIKDSSLSGNSTITANYGSNVGGLVGLLENASSIVDSSVSQVTISATKDPIYNGGGYNAGGLVGGLKSSSISNSNVAGSVSISI